MHKITQMDRVAKSIERENNHNRKLDGEMIHDRKGKGRDRRWLHRSSQRNRTHMFWREVEAVTELARCGWRENVNGGGNDGKRDKGK